MPRFDAKCGERIQQSLAAARRRVSVLFDEILFVRLVCEVTAYERQVVTRGEGSPRAVFDHGPPITVRPCNKNNNRAQRTRIFGTPQSELRLVVVLAGGNRLVDGSNSRLRQHRHGRDQESHEDSSKDCSLHIHSMLDLLAR